MSSSKSHVLDSHVYGNIQSHNIFSMKEEYIMLQLTQGGFYSTAPVHCAQLLRAGAYWRFSPGGAHSACVSAPKKNVCTPLAPIRQSPGSYQATSWLPLGNPLKIPFKKKQSGLLFKLICILVSELFFCLYKRTLVSNPHIILSVEI